VESFLIGCGAGFSGDRIDAAAPVVRALVAAGKPAAMMFETLAERTLALGHVARRKNPESGYEAALPALLAPILADCVRHGIPIVGNFGAANPCAAARRIHDLGCSLGLSSLRIAVVQGDDVRDRIDLDELSVWEGDSGLPESPEELIAANVYLGAREIALALTQGAQVVVTGRVADPALALGPLVAHFGWSWNDWGRLAAGTMVGHLLECGAQVTGGYFADPGYKEVPDPATIGFPIAEVSSDGSAIITKPPGTGGLVSSRTVKEQLLYEIHDPAAYLTPDVVLDLSSVRVECAGHNRVRVSGARGRPRPPTLKAMVSFPGDWLGEAEISYAGPNALARARLAAQTISQRLRLRELDVRSRFDLIGVASVFDSDKGELQDAATAECDDVRMRLAVSGKAPEPVEQSLQEVLALYCCGPAGGGGVRSQVRNRIRTVSYLVPRELVAPTVSFFEEGQS